MFSVRGCCSVYFKLNCAVEWRLSRVDSDPHSKEAAEIISNLPKKSFSIFEHSIGKKKKTPSLLSNFNLRKTRLPLYLHAKWRHTFMYCPTFDFLLFHLFYSPQKNKTNWNGHLYDRPFFFILPTGKNKKKKNRPQQHYI